METIGQDVRYALRQLRRAPGFAITAVLTLALGIGVTVTVMALVYRVLLAPLPYPEPGRIVAVQFQRPSGVAGDNTTGPAGELVLRSARSFEAAAFVGAVHLSNFSRHGGQPLSVETSGVSRQYFDVLGVHPAMGHSFTADEDIPGGPAAAVLSYGFWQSELGGDPGIVGRVIELNGEPVSVAGVMPKGFRTSGETIAGASASPAIWTDLQVGPQDPGYDYDNYSMLARLRDGVSVTQAQAELNALEMRLYQTLPFYARRPAGASGVWSYRLWPYAEVLAASIRPSLVVMSWAAAAALLLTCLNLAGLNMARALRRAPEFGLRMALGAGRKRLLWLALQEVAVIALAGSVLATVVARLLLVFLLQHSPVPVPQLSTGSGWMALMATAMLVGMVCALSTGLPFALVLVWRVGARSSIGQRKSTDSRAQAKAASAIVVGQLALSLVLLAAAGLLLGTLQRLEGEPLGFNPQKLVMFQASLKGKRFETTQATNVFVQKVTDHLESTPGVRSASASFGLPLVRGLNDDGWAHDHPEHDKLLEVRTVAPGFSRTIGLNLLAGRQLDRDDTAAAQRVVVISEATARAFWPGQPAVGKTLNVDSNAGVYRVAGIVTDTPANNLGQAPDLIVYAPIAQQPDKVTAMVNGWFPVSFVVREDARLDAAAIARAAVASADPTIPVAGLTTMRAVVDDSVAAPRFFTQIAAGFAGFAVLLTAVGLFGLLSYQVTQRTREIGVRMALGATRGRILRGVLRASAMLCAMGGAAGVAVAALLVPAMKRWVEQVAVIDPSQTQYLPGGVWTVGAALLVLCVTALVAAALPARRAARVEPMEALRAE